MRNKIFDPQPLFQDHRTPAEKEQAPAGDRRDGKVYSYTEDLVLAVNVALATGRPLLFRGAAGCGKSSAAYNIARILGRCYYEEVVTSRMEARDLLWRFDAVRRLGDAQVRGAGGQAGSAEWRQHHPYIKPGVLWWLFDADSAEKRGIESAVPDDFVTATPPLVWRPSNDTPVGNAVLLIDEIDKAEPDVPNNLLVALGSSQFQVDEIGFTVKFTRPENGSESLEKRPLVIITTNEERQLPPAFLRRCVVYRFGAVSDERLIEIARGSEGSERRDENGLYLHIATTMRDMAEEMGGSRSALSIAEYLDAVRACRHLGIDKDSDEIQSVIERTSWKQASRD